MNGDLESEAYALAPVLGLSVYDARLRLSSVLPRIVFQSSDRNDALRVLGVLRQRGHGAVACDVGALRKPGDLVKVHRFSWDANALYANGPGSVALSWSEVAVVVEVQARTDVLREKKEVDFVQAGRRAERIERVVSHHENTMDLSAYVFPQQHQDGTPHPPWVVHEREAQYLSLGQRMQPTRRANFMSTIALIREHARGAIFDDRFVKSPIHTQDFIMVSGSDEARSDIAPRGVDVQATLLALWLERSSGGPYR